MNQDRNPQYLSESHIEELTTKHHLSQNEGQIVELLLEKKSTRSGTYYKVRRDNYDYFEVVGHIVNLVL